MKQLTTDKKEQIFLAVFTVLPATLFFPLSEYVTDNSATRILISGLFCGLGALLGFALYRMTKNNSDLIKIIVLVTFLIIEIIIIRTVHNYYQS